MPQLFLDLCRQFYLTQKGSHWAPVTTITAGSGRLPSALLCPAAIRWAGSLWRSSCAFWLTVSKTQSKQQWELLLALSSSWHLQQQDAAVPRPAAVLLFSLLPPQLSMAEDLPLGCSGLELSKMNSFRSSIYNALSPSGTTDITLRCSESHRLFTFTFNFHKLPLEARKIYVAQCQVISWMIWYQNDLSSCSFYVIQLLSKFIC